MATTYFAADFAGDPDIGETAGLKCVGAVRIFVNTDPPTPTNKYVFVGEDMLQTDYAGFRTISVQERNAIVNEIERWLGLRGARMADYARSLNNTFFVAVSLPQSTVNGI